MTQLTTTQAADILNLSTRRIVQMLTQPCPACDGQAEDCARCRGTGVKLPHSIPYWAVELPDNKYPVQGQPSGVPGVTLAQEKDAQAVYYEGRRIGWVYQDSDARRSWVWFNDDNQGGQFRSRKAAILELLEATK